MTRQWQTILVLTIAAFAISFNDVNAIPIKRQFNELSSFSELTDEVPFLNTFQRRQAQQLSGLNQVSPAVQQVESVTSQEVLQSEQILNQQLESGTSELLQRDPVTILNTDYASQVGEIEQDVDQNALLGSLTNVQGSGNVKRDEEQSKPVPQPKPNKLPQQNQPNLDQSVPKQVPKAGQPATNLGTTDQTTKDGKIGTTPSTESSIQQQKQPQGSQPASTLGNPGSVVGQTGTTPNMLGNGEQQQQPAGENANPLTQSNQSQQSQSQESQSTFLNEANQVFQQGLQTFQKGFQQGLTTFQQGETVFNQGLNGI